MPAQNQNTNCDRQRLCRYLEQRLTAQEEFAVEAHLEECPECRQQIRDSAADDDSWARAGRYLKADVWDEAEGWTPDSLDSSTRDRRASAAVVIRQIREWLDPTDDPQFIGRFGGYEI